MTGVVLGLLDAGTTRCAEVGQKAVAARCHPQAEARSSVTASLRTLLRRAGQTETTDDREPA